jgi:hypothetical protein
VLITAGHQITIGLGKFTGQLGTFLRGLAKNSPKIGL